MPVRRSACRRPGGASGLRAQARRHPPGVCGAAVQRCPGGRTRSRGCGPADRLMAWCSFARCPTAMAASGASWSTACGDGTRPSRRRSSGRYRSPSPARRSVGAVATRCWNRSHDRCCTTTPRPGAAAPNRLSTTVCLATPVFWQVIEHAAQGVPCPGGRGPRGRGTGGHRSGVGAARKWLRPGAPAARSACSFAGNGQKRALHRPLGEQASGGFQWLVGPKRSSRLRASST